jgi:hypothetical protein
MNEGNKILLFSRDPGGANTIFPLAMGLQRKGYAVFLYGKDMALKIYSDHGLSGSDISKVISGGDIDEIENWLCGIKPDFIITGTSAYDFTEKYIWSTAKKLNIPSFAILDSWINYGLRFSNYTIFETEKYATDRQHPFLPDKIMVMDEFAKEEMVKDGFDGSMVLVSGHPYFEELMRMRDDFMPENRSRFRNQLGINATDFLITFASEPISTTYKQEGGLGLYWGYDEKTIVKAILEALKYIVHAYTHKIIFLIKLHPKENPATYTGYIDDIGSDKIKILINNELDSLKLILSSDLICGMFSMFLIEAVILDKPVISTQIGLKRENPFILNKRNILKSILTKDDLLSELKKIILKDKKPKCYMDVINNPISNIMQEMEGYLCRN